MPVENKRERRIFSPMDRKKRGLRRATVTRDPLWENPFEVRLLEGKRSSSVEKANSSQARGFRMRAAKDFAKFTRSTAKWEATLSASGSKKDVVGKEGGSISSYLNSWSRTFSQAT